MIKRNWREFDNSVSESTANYSSSITPKANLIVRVQRIKAGKKGKTVTLIKGLELNQSEARSILKKMKSRCGTGGTVKEDLIELQGDQVHAVMNFLQTQGYQPKQAGG